MAEKMDKIVKERMERAKRILPILKHTYPTAKCSLDFGNPLELLVATILSAQCTDERVNKVTPDLFRKYRSAADLAQVPQEELERDIQSTGFYRNKAKALRGMGSALVERFGGQVPDAMEELTSLPGVGRKTANVVLGNAFGKTEGIVVDTHVARVSQRLFLTTNTDASKIEQDLMAVIPWRDWTLFAHLLIYHGRRICVARNPQCTECPLLPHCPTGQKLVKQRKRP